MKTTRLLFLFAIFSATLISCNDNGWLWNDDPNLFVEVQEQGKTSTYRGGNVECDQIATVLGLGNVTFSVSLKQDYNGSFSTPWEQLAPGLEVRVTGNTVDWWTSGSVQIDGTCYEVGAVILKSATYSNIYYYGTEGAERDKGLVTYTGQALSNLTFCFVPCSEEPKKFIISAKSYVYSPEWGNVTSAKSTGTYLFSASTCVDLGYNYYPFAQTVFMKKALSTDFVGSVATAEVYPLDSEGNPVHSLKVTVTYTGNVTVNKTWLYVGSLIGFSSVMDSGCPDYESINSLFHSVTTPTGTTTQVHEFIIPFSSITTD